MDKIRLYALGGLGEDGKNMYVVDVNRQLIILDAGIKFPTIDQYGVDEIIPDYKFLLRYVDKIKGIFLSHAHEDHIGAVAHILADMNIPVYATKFTMAILKNSLEEKGLKPENYKLNTIDSNMIISFENVKVYFFNTSHSIPESVGIAIQTLSGTIVYTSEFTFEQNHGANYKTDFSKLNKIADKNVIALLIESVGSRRTQIGGLFEKLKSKIHSIFQTAKGRIIASVFETDILRLNLLINMAIDNKRKVAIISSDMKHKSIDIAAKMGYINLNPDCYVELDVLTDTDLNDDDNLLVIVTGKRLDPFKLLQKMSRGKNNYIKINEEDTVIMLTPPLLGIERIANKTIDDVSRTDARVEVIRKENLPSGHATSDEIRMMINLLHPKYVLPVIGEYQFQHKVKQISLDMGYKEEEVFLLDNGDVLNLDEKPYVSKGDISPKDIFIDGTALEEGNDFVMHDREILAKDGIVLIVGHLSQKTKTIIGEVEVIQKGFLYEGEEKLLVEKIIETFKTTVSTRAEEKYINWNDLKRDLRNDIARVIKHLTNRNPITIPMVIATDNLTQLISNTEKTEN
jgi:ribonuclease J